MADRIKAPRGGFDEWTVVGEPTLREHGDALWLARGYVPRMTLGRWMAVARMEDGTVLVHSPVALPDEQMARIEAWGDIAFIVVPTRFHRLDAKVFARRYPNAKIVCPAGARAKVEAVVPVDLTYDDFEGDAVVSLEHVAGLKDAEGVLTVRSPEGTSLVFGDLFFNLDHGPGFAGLVVRLIGSSGGPRVTRLYRLAVVKDKRALQGALQRLADTDDLVCLVPGHGRIVTDDAAGTLRAVAERL